MAILFYLSHEFFIWWKWPANRAKVIELLLSKFNDSRVNCIHCHISYIYVYYLKPLAFWNEFHIDICIHLIVQNFIFFISYLWINCENVASFHLMYVLGSYILTFILKYLFPLQQKIQKSERKCWQSSRISRERQICTMLITPFRDIQWVALFTLIYSEKHFIVIN